MRDVLVRAVIDLTHEADMIPSNQHQAIATSRPCQRFFADNFDKMFTTVGTALQVAISCILQFLSVTTSRHR